MNKTNVRNKIFEYSPFSEEKTEEIYRTRFFRMPAKLKRVIKEYNLDNKRVLDVGCGHGHCLIHFGEGSVGIEIREEYVKFAKAIGLNVVKCDIDEGLEKIPNEYFDAIWCSDILEHTNSPHIVLNNLNLKLKWGG